MDFVEIKSPNPIQIQSYEPGKITISQKSYQQHLIVTPDQVIENALPDEVEQLTDTQLQHIISFKPTIVLIGTGHKQVFSTFIQQWFLKHQVGVEFMDTAAACRTFQILTSEKRRVIAVLFL